LTLVLIPSPLQLARLSFISSTTQQSASARATGAVSLLSLGSSFVLLAGITTHAPELVLLLWDLQYSVVLASHSLPIPPYLSYNKEGVNLSLAPASSSQALLVLTPQSPKPQSTSRSSVLVVPFTAPLKSTIANAIGRASSGIKWLVQSESVGERPIQELSIDRREVLKKMRTAIEQNWPEAADTAFFDWYERRKSAMETQRVRYRDPDN